MNQGSSLLSAVVPFSLHQVTLRKKAELSTETRLGTVSVWREGPLRRMQRASELLHHPQKYSTNKVVSCGNGVILNAYRGEHPKISITLIINDSFG